MTDLPETGGSFVRDPVTGKLLRQADPEEPAKTGAEPAQPAVDDPEPAQRRATNKGGI